VPILCRVIKQAYRFTLMQIKLFTIPVAVTMAHMLINLLAISIGDSGSTLQEMNTFLKAHNIPEIQQNMISNNKKANGCYCVRFIDRVLSACAGRRVRGHLNDFVLRAIVHIFEAIGAGVGLLPQCYSSAKVMVLKPKGMYGERERSLRQPVERGYRAVFC
jgi:hypothetical protein